MALARSHHDLLDQARARVDEVLADRWTLRSLLGAGGVAAVFEALHRNNKRVAIKILHLHLAHDDDVRERFLREAYVANSIGHPAVVEIDDDGEDDAGSPFLVMPYVDGVTLEAHRIERGGTLAPAELLPLVAQLLDVLVAAHARGVVHRDLKPDNLMLSAGGVLRVLDFGLARALQHEPEQQLTQPGAILGTPRYMAPEQALGRWELVDARTDLWAVGAICFQALSGRPVHQGHTMQETLALAGTAHAPALDEVLPDVPPELAAFVDRALIYAKADRYADAEEMATELREVVLPALDVSLPDALVSRTIVAPELPVERTLSSADTSHIRAMEHADTVISGAPPPSSPALSSPSQQSSQSPSSQRVSVQQTSVQTRVQWLPLLLAGLLGSALVWGIMGWQSRPAAPGDRDGENVTSPQASPEAFARSSATAAISPSAPRDSTAAAIASASPSGAATDASPGRQARSASSSTRSSSDPTSSRQASSPKPAAAPRPRPGARSSTAKPVPAAPVPAAAPLPPPRSSVPHNPLDIRK